MSVSLPCALRRAALLSALAVLMPPAWAEEPVTGTGATFPAKVYLQWAEDHTRLTREPVKYLPAGSSAGVKAVSEGTVDFGASDVPLSAAELEKRGLFQFPTLVGGIVPFVNLPGVANGQLRLDAPTLARIWAGSISRWNDTAIRQLNPDLELPA
ncbi:MAG: substrate-binding domain-containing protein, partial [Hydrogenophaga sp.]|nr:substrate-binding domain-containing protein [Hydrogenophaga sp.]